MARLNSTVQDIIDDDRPLSLRRKRRSSIGAHNNIQSSSSSSSSKTSAISTQTPPATPKRTKKRVRFSDPGPEVTADYASTSSGLTPSLRRASLSALPSASRKHVSTPGARRSRSGAFDASPTISGTLQFAPMRQVLDGRVKRRLRRNGLSEEVNIIESDKRTYAKKRRAELSKLRRELEEKDAEVQSLRDEHDLASQLGYESGMGMEGSFDTTTTLSSKVTELEQEVEHLKAKLQRKEDHHSSHGDEHEDEEEDWTMAAQDPFDHDDDETMDDEHDNTMMNYDHDDNDHDFTMNDDSMDLTTTPARLNTSFPSPPETLPNTPCASTTFSGTSTGVQAELIIPSINAGIQTATFSTSTGNQTATFSTTTGIQTLRFSKSLGIQASLPVPDPENITLKSQLQSLETEIETLNKTLAFNNDQNLRFTSKLSDFLPLDQSHDHTTLDAALDRVLTTLALAQSKAKEDKASFQALSTEIKTLGFPGASPDAALELIANQFRQARLELEYVMPGEIEEGFENERILGLLVERVKTLVVTMKQRDESIDQYHDQEILLRQQLGTRVQAMDDLRTELDLANGTAEELRTEISELGTGNERLKSALEGYRSEVRSLEELIERLENEGRDKETEFQGKIGELDEQLQDAALQQEIAKADAEGKDMLISELESRLSLALQSAAELQAQLESMTTSKDTTINERDQNIAQLNSDHGNALALRDARVSELREEVERVNDSLKAAHTAILELRKENEELRSLVEGEKQRGLLVVNAMRQQMKAVLDIGEGYINGDVSVRTSAEGPGINSDSESAPLRFRDSGMGGGMGSSPLSGMGTGSGAAFATPQSGVVRKGRFMDGELARRGSGSGRMGKKRRRRYDSGLGFLEEEGEEMGEVFSSDL